MLWVVLSPVCLMVFHYQSLPMTSSTISTVDDQAVNAGLREEIEAIIHDRLSRHYHLALSFRDVENADQLGIPNHLTIDQIFWHVSSVMHLLVHLSKETGEDLEKIILMSADLLRELHDDALS